jgi:hypothetical protein
MEGYDVVTTDGEKVGKVVGTHGEHLIVEQGTLRKSKHALPETFVEVDDGEQVVRMSISKDVFCDSPKIDDGAVDEQAVAEHYGLTPATAVDPSGHAEQDAMSGNVLTAPEERLRTREEMEKAEGGGVPAESPALLGDRYEHTKE